MAGQSLSDGELRELLASIGPLADTVQRQYEIERPPRPLWGSGGVVIRTVGEDFHGPDRYNPTYFEERKGYNVPTEFAEFIEALREYDRDGSLGNAVSLYQEVGDVLFQRCVVEVRHPGAPDYARAVEKLDEAMTHIRTQLESRGLSLFVAERLAQVKYGMLAWLGEKGRKRDRELENRICLEALVRMGIADKPK